MKNEIVYNLEFLDESDVIYSILIKNYEKNDFIKEIIEFECVDSIYSDDSEQIFFKIKDIIYILDLFEVEFLEVSVSYSDVNKLRESVCDFLNCVFRNNQKSVVEFFFDVQRDHLLGKFQGAFLS
ncbi:hypothetical protein C5L14_08945 [Labrys okinawensis]|uniref:Uncharacterized protein n=1 Tax=Labrys okinawensis TaxID=346911 RepID=A0A2S9QF88_9HYPH|nr:hypothetical protein [Labrys okinawensis]PRH88014.1 hypothetical protein C5L14_08945 [Labrys okinawensis]